MIKQKLRIGLLIDSYDLPLWSYKMIETINNSNHSKVVLVVRNNNQVKKIGFFANLWMIKSELLLLLYSKLEKKLYRLNPNAFEIKNLKSIVNCPEIVVQPNTTKFSDRILEDDINEIKTHNIDVFIRLGFRILRGEILNAAKYGVWSYHHGDNRVNRGGPAGIWEMLNLWDEVGVVLQILTEDLDGGTILYESRYKTDNLFIYRNKNNYYLKLKEILPRKLKELHSLGEEQFVINYKKRNSKPLFYYNKLFKYPKNSETFIGLVKLYWSAFKKVIKRNFYFEQWIILFKLEKTNKISQSFYKFKRLLPPKDRFWADPFIIKRDNIYCIFIEELLYSEDKGKISVIEMDEKGNYTEPVVVLEKDYHLSYPFLIEDKSTLYMIPETKENNTIELYKCTEFPLKWELDKVLFNDIKAVDNTIFKHNNKFWLFTNVEEYEGMTTVNELLLFYTDSLLDGEWIEHPNNPIATDHTYSRPAGNIFIYEDRIFRPAQNCSKHYGYGMQVREIVTLNETEFEERQVQSIYPNWDKDLISTHTLNSSNNLTVIDAKIKRSKYNLAFKKTKL
jgi:hypothetical protein